MQANRKNQSILTKDFSEIKRDLENHHEKSLNELKRKHKKTLAAAKNKGISLAGAILISSTTLAGSHSEIKNPNTQKKVLLTDWEYMHKIKSILSQSKENQLSTEQETEIAKVLSERFGVKATPSLTGNRLNEIYGYIGAEQHLYRWQGDSLSQHDEFQRAGIAPAKGAFGYFDTVEQEKYYLAVQLHELPDWNQNWSKLKPWYRFRKMLVYNPDNGKAVVAVIGDSGPAKFTGKTFGGSPEVMNYLERVDGGQKGKVIILFLDDPEQKIALGPIEDLDSQNLALNQGK